MNLPDLSTFLEDRLKEPLPGIDIQRKMMARPDSKFRFDPGSREFARHSGVLVLFYQDGESIKMPLILRHDYDGAHSGQVSFPGGRVEPEDVDIVDTALREAEEEIGIDKQSVRVLGQLTDLFIPVSNYLVFPVVGVTDKAQDFIPEEREVSRILHPSLTDLLDPEVKKEKLITIRDFRINAPYFDLEGQVVWGATAMMLSELRHLLEEFRDEAN